MSTFGRRGHWRTNSDGNMFWISEHKVTRETYTLSQKDNQHFVNGHRLLETICNYCYTKIYYASIGENKKLFFNKDLSSLSIHDCRKKTEIKGEKRPLRETKPFFNSNDIRALERRADEIKNRNSENSDSENRAKNLNKPGKISRKRVKTIIEMLSRANYSIKNIISMLFQNGLDVFDPVINQHVGDLNRKNAVNYFSKKDCSSLRKFISNSEAVLRANEKSNIFADHVSLRSQIKELKEILVEIDRVKQTKIKNRKSTNKPAQIEVHKKRKLTTESEKEQAEELTNAYRAHRERAKLAELTVEVKKTKVLSVKRDV